MPAKALVITYVGDASRVLAAQAQIGKSATGMQSSVAKTGAMFKSTFGSVVPLTSVAAGLAVAAFAKKSVDAAIAYDEAFTRIAAISNASASDMERWKEQVLDLAGETARAPAELADALFFLSSAGLEAGQVMSTLEMSAKASAAGLGSTVDIAKITANALNAYASSGLTAAEATDVLVAAVREGSAEPEEFAAALGRILPIASQAGIEFDQVTASLAALSNIGLDVNEGVTAMRGLMTALLAPTHETTAALADLGLSTDDVRASLAEDGLIATLQMLEEATGGNIDKMKALVPNARALTGVFGLTGQEAAKVQAIFDNVADSSGSLGEAFGETADSEAFKLKKALNDVAIAGQELATEVLPALAEAATFLSGAVRALTGDFGGLTVSADEAVEGLLAGDEATRKLAERWTGSLPTLEEFKAATHAFTGEVALATQATDAATQAIGDMDDATVKATDVTDELAEAQREATNAAREQRLAVLALSDQFLGILDSANQVAEAQRELNRLSQQGGEGTQAYKDAVLEAIGAQGGFEASIISYTQELLESGETQRDVIGKIRDLGGEFKHLSEDALRKLIDKVRDYINSLNDIPSTVTTKIVTTGGGGVIKTAHGFHGLVTRPSLFLAGEAGPERVDIGPERAGVGTLERTQSRSSQVMFAPTINLSGTVLGADKRRLAEALVDEMHAAFLRKNKRNATLGFS